MAKKPTKPAAKPTSKPASKPAAKPAPSLRVAASAKSTARKPSGGASVKLDSLTHNDSRVNIPTEDLRDFYHKANPEPPAPTLYPRNPDLDPQLVWRGKDSQDKAGLEVPVVPIYIQEKIHPQAIIEDFKRTAPKAASEIDQGAGLFDHYAAFNGLPKDFAERVDFYHHQGHWQNRLILGDSLLVMNSLAEKEGLKSRVQCVYFDPPYGIKFGSNWQVSTRKRDVKDGKAEDVVRQPEQMRAFRDTWELGIHSYLAYLRDRLTIARELLTDSGSIFVQIGDENVHLVRSVMDEVFGSENWISTIQFRKTGAAGSGLLDNVADSILWYAQDIERVKYRPLFQQREAGTSLFDVYRLKDETGRSYASAPLTSGRPRQAGDLAEFEFEGRIYKPATGTFKTDFDGMTKLRQANRLLHAPGALRYKRYLDDFEVAPFSNLWTDTMGAAASEKYMLFKHPPLSQSDA